MPDVVHQPGNLELLVVPEVAAQQLGTLAIVVQDVDRIAAAVRHVPGVLALREQAHQVIDGSDRHAAQTRQPR
jgi:hypothetical protein